MRCEAELIQQQIAEKRRQLAENERKRLELMGGRADLAGALWALAWSRERSTDSDTTGRTASRCP